MTSIFQSFTYKMATKTNLHRYGTKLRQCHPMFSKCPDKLATKIAKVYCDKLLSARSSNFIIPTFVFISHKIFSVRLFVPPRLLLAGGIVPSAPTSYTTAIKDTVGPCDTAWNTALFTP